MAHTYFNFDLSTLPPLQFITGDNLVNIFAYFSDYDDMHHLFQSSSMSSGAHQYSSLVADFEDVLFVKLDNLGIDEINAIENFFLSSVNGQALPFSLKDNLLSITKTVNFVNSNIHISENAINSFSVNLLLREV